MRLPITIATFLLLTLFLSGCVHVPVQPQPPVPPISDNQEEEWQMPEELAMYDIARITSTEQILPLEKPIDTSDWNVYRDEECGFEIRYPDNWKTETRRQGVPCEPTGTNNFSLISYAYDKEVAEKRGELETGYIKFSFFPKKELSEGKAPIGFGYYGGG